MANTNSNVVSVDTLGNLFSREASLMVLQCGANNTETDLGVLHNVFIPRDYTDTDGNTVDMVANFAAYQRWLAANWNGKRSKFAGLTEEEKVSLASDPRKAGFTPSEAGAQSPLELAVQRILVKLNPKAFEGKTSGQIASSPNVQKAIAEILNDPARTEKYRDRIEAEMTSILSETEMRSRKTKSEDGAALEY